MNSLIKKGIAVAVILLFFGVSVIPSTGTTIVEKTSTVSFDGNTLYVGGSGPGNYSKIQDAINDSSDGDMVFVFNGTYVENLVVDKSIDLIGEDKETTVIDGSDYNGDYTVYIGDPYVTLTGFTIQKGTHGGILVNGDTPYGDSYSNTIYGNIIRKNNYIGIGLANSANNKIYRNNITNHEWGICAQGFHGYSSNNTIYQNNIMKNGIGIYFLKGFDGDVSNKGVTD